MGLLKHEVTARDVIFQDIRQRPVINLVNLIHEYSHLISLDIVAGYWELKTFEPSQFNWVTRETRYHLSIAELLKPNLSSQVVELFQLPRTGTTSFSKSHWR